MKHLLYCRCKQVIINNQCKGKRKMNDKIIDVKEAFKLLIDNKLVICHNSYVYERHKRNISKKINNEHVGFLGYPEFLIEEEYSIFKEYVEPKKFEFEGSVVEINHRSIKFDYYIDDKYIEKLGKCWINKVKFKITIEEILE